MSTERRQTFVPIACCGVDVRNEGKAQLAFAPQSLKGLVRSPGGVKHPIQLFRYLLYAILIQKVHSLRDNIHISMWRWTNILGSGGGNYKALVKPLHG